MPPKAVCSWQGAERMKLPSSISGSNAGAVFLVPEPWKAWAQTYPARPVLLSVGLAAGGGTDLVARLVAEWLSRRLGQPFIVENRTGMGGNLSIERVLKSPPDGYTLLFAAPNSTIGASLYRKLPFDFRRDSAAGCIRHAFSERHGRVSVVAGAIGAGVHRLRQSVIRASFRMRHPGTEHPCISPAQCSA